MNKNLDGQMTNGTSVGLAEALKRARVMGQKASIAPSDLPATPEQAYAASSSQVRDVAAWKIGGANPWSRKVFNNQEIFFGPLQEQELVSGAGSLSLQGLLAPLAEPEVMLEIADWNATTPSARFSRMALGFEIPATVLPEDLKPELMGQIADRAGAGAIWLTGIRAFDIACFEQPLLVEMQLNADDPIAGSTENVISGPLGAAAEFFSLALRYDMPLEPGQWIATGGLCPAVPVVPGDRLALRSNWGHFTLQLE